MLRTPAHAALLLTAMLATASCGASGTEPARLTATVVASPACPEQPPSTASPECRDRPLPDTSVTIIADDDRIVAREVTDERGRLNVELPAGDYVVQVEQQPGMVDEPQPLAVHLEAGETAEVSVPVDTGVR